MLPPAKQGYLFSVRYQRSQIKPVVLQYSLVYREDKFFTRFLSLVSSPWLLGVAVHLRLILWSVHFRDQVNPHQVGVSESLIRWGGGRSAPHLYMAIGGYFHYFFKTGILSWMKRARIQKHSPLPLKLKPSEFFEKLIFLAKIQNS